MARDKGTPKNKIKTMVPKYLNKPDFGPPSGCKSGDWKTPEYAGYPRMHLEDE